MTNKQVMQKLLEMVDEIPVSPNKTPKKPKAVKSVTGDTFAKSKYINVHKRRETTDRSKYQCEYPCCNKPVDEFHHPDHISVTHSHENLRHLCKEHHQMAHNGLIKNEQQEPGQWELDLNSSLRPADRQYRKYRKEAER